MSISLSKGQRISLAKTATGGGITKAHMGLGWDATPIKSFFGRSKERSIDLDASCIVFDANNSQIDQIWFNQLKSRDGAIVHTGDNRSGEGDGDDESIIVDLTQLNPAARTLVFVVNSYSGETFDQIENAFCRLVDLGTGAEIARYSLTGSGSHTAQIMAKLSKDADGWTMEALGIRANGRTIQDVSAAVAASL